MKFPTEFQPGRVLGSAIMFLIFFCAFCVFGNPSGFDTTTSTIIETDTATEKTVPDPHKIGIVGKYRFDQKIECRGADVSNLTVIFCETSILDCRKKLPCLLNGTECKNHYDISSGTDCDFDQIFRRFNWSLLGLPPPPPLPFSLPPSGALSDEDSDYDDEIPSKELNSSETTTEKCLKIPDVRYKTAGVVKCVSSLPSAVSSVQPNTNATTIHYFYTGNDNEVHLLSSVQPPVESLLRLSIGDKHVLGEEEPTLIYTNEEIRITCSALELFFDLKSIKIKARTENGTEYPIDPALYSGGWGLLESLLQRQKYLTSFRVPKDIHSFSCGARRLDTFEIVRTTRNITVIDPPSQIFVKAANGSEFQVDSRIGCHLSPSHTPQEFKDIRTKVFDLLDNSRLSELWITSVIKFLRFQNITQGNFSCSPLKADASSNSKCSSNENETSNADESFDYCFDPEVKKPRIEKPAGGATTVVLNGQDHRSLVCKYTGNPRPYVIWLQNGKEIFYTVGWRLTTEPGFEMEVLNLPLKNPDNLTEIFTGVYSCVVHNHLGVDRLDFIIEKETTSPFKSEENNNGLIYGVLFSCLFLLNLVALGFWFLRGNHSTKRTVVTKVRAAQNAEQCVTFEEVSDRSIQNPSQSHNRL